VAHVYSAQYQVIEIAEDAELLTLYEVKIPVLKRLDTNTEINWPFTTEDIRQLLR
ncbi:MAG: glutaredoxin family protein, partial [Methylotenera sp.]|nr:glutaredoxin family protein [Methylotenera sp.]